MLFVVLLEGDAPSSLTTFAVSNKFQRLALISNQLPCPCHVKASPKHVAALHGVLHLGPVWCAPGSFLRCFFTYVLLQSETFKEQLHL